MNQIFKIELEDDLLKQLTQLCKDHEITLQDLIVKILKERLSQNRNNNSSIKKDGLETYLNKGQSGSQSYGVKGQGW